MRDHARHARRLETKTFVLVKYTYIYIYIIGLVDQVDLVMVLARLPQLHHVHVVDPLVFSSVFSLLSV